jgi:hypothetical protein
MFSLKVSVLRLADTQQPAAAAAAASFSQAAHQSKPINPISSIPLNQSSGRRWSISSQEGV